jgi:hypothetical protein
LAHLPSGGVITIVTRVYDAISVPSCLLIIAYIPQYNLPDGSVNISNYWLNL